LALSSKNIRPNWLTDGIKAAIRERQRFGQPRLPCHRRRLAPRHCQHPFVAVEPDDRPVRRHPLCRLARQNAGSAGNVQHPLTSREPRRIGQARRAIPGSELARKIPRRYPPRSA
jgi:hypothetical protein